MGDVLCRPAPERCGVTGMHWVQKETGVPVVMRWGMNHRNGEMEWWDFNAEKMVSAESETARYWQYIAPAGPPPTPDVVKALVATLKGMVEIAEQEKWDLDAVPGQRLGLARIALKAAREAGL